MRIKKNTQPSFTDDKSFFQEFYEENKGFLFFTAQKYTSDLSDCEDIVQDTIIRLLNNIPTLRTLDRNRSLKYIALTVRSSFLDHQRKKHTEQMLSVDDQTLEALLHDEANAGPFNPPVSTYLDVMALKQSLPVRDWIILEGRYILGYSYDELSGQTGLTPDNIRMIVSRAKKKARKLLLCTSEKGGDTDER